jgi:hypothetical protein
MPQEKDYGSLLRASSSLLKKDRIGIPSVSDRKYFVLCLLAVDFKADRHSRAYSWGLVDEEYEAEFSGSGIMAEGRA